MAAFRSNSPIMAALFALILGLFVSGPLVDAVTCGQEAAISCEFALTDADHPADDQGHGQDALHACNHGHCHSTSNLPPVLGDAAVYAFAPASTTLSADPLFVSETPDGLIRPPRA